MNFICTTCSRKFLFLQIAEERHYCKARFGFVAPAVLYLVSRSLLFIVSTYVDIQSTHLKNKQVTTPPVSREGQNIIQRIILLIPKAMKSCNGNSQQLIIFFLCEKLQRLVYYTFILPLVGSQLIQSTSYINERGSVIFFTSFCSNINRSSIHLRYILIQNCQSLQVFYLQLVQLKTY